MRSRFGNLITLAAPVPSRQLDNILAIQQRIFHMAIFELRTYDIVVGKMGEITELYRAEGFPALQAGGFDANLIAYFTGDIGALNQIIHLWRFDDDNARRAFWARLFADPAFMAFAAKLRPLLRAQNNKLMMAAPWGPSL
ncbi:MAG: NIPSNAP family protein [Burkholderiaceae bacterium]